MLQLMHTTPLNEIYSSSFTDEQRKQIGKQIIRSAHVPIASLLQRKIYTYNDIFTQEEHTSNRHYYFTKKLIEFFDYAEN